MHIQSHWHQHILWYYNIFKAQNNSGDRKKTENILVLRHCTAEVKNTTQWILKGETNRVSVSEKNEKNRKITKSKKIKRYFSHEI